MTIASARSLVEILSRGKLLEPDQLAELIRTLPARPADPLSLARELLQRGWLTPYQINQLFQGRAADLVLGHYVLLERLGEGGMGQVFKAREQRLGRIVALKILRKELVKPDLIRRFHQEIQAAARLSHPNVVHAYDAEQVGDAHIFAMEYIAGIDLSRLIKQSGSLPVPQACEYIRQAALGLQHIHEHGMVHRDIKPANLIRATHGEVIKILDMGLARLLDDDADEAPATKLTRLGVVMGTIDYIAPEQALNSHRADIRSDLYSLGCTFYFLLTARVPFPLDEPMAKLLAHQCDEAVAVEQLRPEVPARVLAIVGKLMAKRPDERYQTPAELVLDLAALTPPVAQATVPAGQVVRPSPPPLAIPIASAVPSVSPGGQASRRKSPSRRSKLWIAIAVILSPLLIGWLVHLFRAPAVQNRQDVGPTASSPKEILRNSLGMKLVRIPVGEFFIGSEKREPHHRPNEAPSHQVTITEPFYLGANLVTVGNFRAFVKATNYRTEAEKAGDTRPGHYWLKPGWEQSDDYPVACLSWNDAKAFCDWLSKKESRTYRLPTEAEWEYACRAGSTSAYSYGPDAKKLSEYAWYRGNSGEKAHRVGQRKPNRWGLYDMHGNLLEWCSDYYDAKFYDKVDLIDPHGPHHGSERVLRGGSWNSEAHECRCAYRCANKPTEHRNDRGGFRVLLVSTE
ncbi:MAG TPA: bifunctional serine/threonine-protein kinase/formylglycine-generating enzyme family protein [Gemmataceae bacterium]|nr:bifunctional serine/threonine-protein kinase/formylglycine-generating enzyme family protein [Gemmataceae bacterium]